MLINYFYSIKNQYSIIMKSMYLLFFVLLPATLFSQTAQIVLTFEGEQAGNGNYLALDSVYVVNIHKECDTTVYGASPELLLEYPVGVNENEYANRIDIMTISPNPFSGSTTITVYAPNKNWLVLTISAMNGNRLAHYKTKHPAGIHQFKIMSGNYTTLLLTVSNGYKKHTKKLINLTKQGGQKAKIQYTGLISRVNSTAKHGLSDSAFHFRPGDSLMMQAFATGYNDTILFDEPHEDKTYTCILSNNEPPEPPYNPFPEHNAQNVDPETTLHWSCADPEENSLVYDVYLDTVQPPQQVAAGIPDTVFQPDTLTSEKTYYWKVDAHDQTGNITTGPLWSFTTSPSWQCGDSLYDLRNEKVYATVQIGEQCWMAENLNYGTRIDGGVPMTDNDTVEKYCYNNLENKCDETGAFYQWDEVVQYTLDTATQGVCPQGWHVPTDHEWKVLEGTVDSQYGVGHWIWNDLGDRGFDAGYHLKATYSWGDGYNGDDLYEFKALSTGLISLGGNSGGEGMQAGFWTSSYFNPSSQPWYREIFNFLDGITRYPIDREYGYSVRCIKDDTD
ncbi:MAG: hypothetical protein K9I94_07090 [Bacteroidales bacterium]|nr:hypothetical protein [Bacteroidales bacterium]